MSVDKDLVSVQQARDLVESAHRAQAEVAQFDQPKAVGMSRSDRERFHRAVPIVSGGATLWARLARLVTRCPLC